MAKIAFILLCHKDASGIIAQARRLTQTGDYVSIHFDARADATAYADIRRALADDPGVTFAERRYKCGWGEWSLVAATLEAVRAAVFAFPDATHFYMLSGDCMPIKTASYAHDFLDSQDCDYLEHNDFFKSDWIKTGIKEERLIYRFWFNERTQSKRYYFALRTQQRLGLKRKIPSDLTVMIGSQWWCLRRQTIEKVLAFCAERPDVMRFFSTTWIPDETFFQTIVPHVVPRKELRNRTLTYLMFTDYGMPANFYNDHYDLLLRQDYLFARKISPEADRLRQDLGALWAADRFNTPIANDATSVFRFLTGRGRVGRRFASRFWETEGTIGRHKKLLIITAKKWHIAKRLTEMIRTHTTIPAVDFLFNELNAHLPDMGGVETTMSKRERHRKVVIKLLFDQSAADSLVICADTSALELMQDFYQGPSEVRILLIDSIFDDTYLAGHIERVGLVGRSPSADAIARLMPTVRRDLEYEADRLRDMGFNPFYQIGPRMDADQVAEVLARFLDLPLEKAQAIASGTPLNDD